MKSLILFVLVAAAAATPIFTGDDVMEMQFKSKNIVMKCKELKLNKLIEMVTDAGLASTLAKQGPFTVFAPTDEAWNALPADVMMELKTNMTALTMLLKYHVHSGTDTTATGSPVKMADQMASNGVIHVIDRVMWPIPMGDVVPETRKEGKNCACARAGKACCEDGSCCGACKDCGPACGDADCKSGNACKCAPGQCTC